MKDAVKKVLRSLGVEVRRAAPASAPAPEADRAAAVCARIGAPIIPPLDMAEYRRECPPLFPAPAPVPASFRPRHVERLDQVVQHKSMETYFEIGRSADGFTLTDDRPQSCYTARQRMLHAAYKRLGPGGIQGGSVLDVGGSSGYYSFFCSRHGAARVVDLEARPDHEDHFELLRQMLRLPDTCVFQQGDMEYGMEALNETFDLVLAQGVMYHVYDHPRFVKNLYRLSRRMVIVEGDCSGRDDDFCYPVIENVQDPRASIYGPSLEPSLSWMIILLRWAGFKDVAYVRPPAEVEESWGFRRLGRAMVVGMK